MQCCWHPSTPSVSNKGHVHICWYSRCFFPNITSTIAAPPFRAPVLPCILPLLQRVNKKNKNICRVIFKVDFKKENSTLRHSVPRSPEKEHKERALSDGQPAPLTAQCLQHLRSTRPDFCRSCPAQGKKTVRQRASNLSKEQCNVMHVSAPSLHAPIPSLSISRTHCSDCLCKSSVTGKRETGLRGLVVGKGQGAAQGVRRVSPASRNCCRAPVHALTPTTTHTHTPAGPHALSEGKPQIPREGNAAPKQNRRPNDHSRCLRPPKQRHGPRWGYWARGSGSKRRG